MIHYVCPSCQAIHTSPDLLIGMTVICKSCRHPIEVPKTSTAAPPSMETAREPAPMVTARARTIPATAAEPEAALPVPSARRPMWRWVVLAVALLLPTAYLAWLVFRAL
jgi:hypothetical protein